MKQIKITKSITLRDEVLKTYFKDIYHYPLVNSQKEIELAKRIKAGDTKAKEELITSNLRFVITVAKQYQGQGLSLSDLIQEGNLGLIQAAELFDPDKKCKFISYAVWWIRQAIIQAIYNVSKTIRFPVTHITKMSKINKAVGELEIKLGRFPTMSEISQELDIPEDKITDALIYNHNCYSSDAKISNDDDSLTIGDLLPSQSVTDSNLIDDSKNQELNQIISNLDYRSQDTIRMFFGLGVQELSLEEIGDKFGTTSERIRQIKEKALILLKEQFGNELKELL